MHVLQPTTLEKRTHQITWGVCILVLCFFLFFNLSKHEPGLARVSPYGEDPYDAVGSFGIQLSAAAALISLMRVLRPRQGGVVSREALTLILKGNNVALVSMLVTLAADGMAMVRYLNRWTGSGTGWILAAGWAGLALAGGLALWGMLRLGRPLKQARETGAWIRVAAVWAAALLALGFYPEAWRETTAGAILTALAGMLLLFFQSVTLAWFLWPGGKTPAFETFLDDLTALYHYMKLRLQGVPLIKKFQLPRRLNPRRHPWLLVILLALGAGLALLAAEGLGEGLPKPEAMLLVAGVYVGIEGAGVLLGYVLFNRYLGIFG